MRPYEWMVKHTPQTEWIEGRGILFLIAFFFIELGAGIFVVSSLFSSYAGEVIGWLVCAVLGGGFHLLYLGHPFRFYRMLLKPQTSWISRGLLFVSGFLALGAIHLVLSFWAHSNLGLLIMVDVFAFLTIIYGGFAMNYVNGIPLWNSALLPVLFTVAGLWGGAEVSMAILLLRGGIGEGPERVIQILLLVLVVIFPTYLISARYGLPAGKVSVSEIVTGNWWPYFWIVVVLMGMVLPVGVTISSLLAGSMAIPVQLLYVSIFFGLLADLVLRYLILKNGFYNPLVQVPASYSYVTKPFYE
ncbi:MAG: polysulfide reductase NrfD [Proteobacteria bacterium]|nr:polysulfide reductase NrfD [Pseudomonadota bacterium]